MLEFLEPLNSEGSILGAILLVYANCVAWIIYRKKETDSFNLSGAEESFLVLILDITSLFATVWVFYYLYSYIGAMKTILFWFVVGTSSHALFGLTSFVSGLHVLLAFISMAVGLYLTISTGV